MTDLTVPVGERRNHAAENSAAPGGTGGRLCSGPQAWQGSAMRDRAWEAMGTPDGPTLEVCWQRALPAVKQIIIGALRRRGLIPEASRAELASLAEDIAEGR